MSEHRLGPEHAGRTVDVAAGDRVVVSVPEIAGTGYTWQVEALPPGARVVDEHYEHPSEGGIGGTARHVFVVDPGAGGTLRLRHLQPWMGEAGVLEDYEVTVRVNG